ncbi:MAG: hypothetical protein QF362_04065 [Candidatus Woesearchaeota archaeon]|jgi:hypothetical protein|nr:hypothetical protein [Candidatus Woesearchaeota archaeon]MDP7506591.1 hypothetical protein [Candidatus Woesearchaeota archaeon]|tara:strand:+ start:572 stop:934 length:363 start_codon:yes stop_codon:yes gene_type:complete
MQKKIGHYSFVVGVVLALLLGLASQFLAGTGLIPWLASLLVVCGLTVGFLNVTGKETKEFLVVSTVLVIIAGLGGASSSLAGVEIVGPYLSGVFLQVLAFIVPAVVVVALKDIWNLTKIS